MKKARIIISIFSLIILFNQAFSQEKAKESGPFTTIMVFTCTSTSDDSIQLKAVISVKHEEGATMLANAAVNFSVTGGESDITIGTAKTDYKGVASFKVPVRNQFPRNEEQLINFKASYAGDKQFNSSEAEFPIKPSKIVLSFYEEDSVKYVKVTATQFDAAGNETPLGPADISISVPKMFSMLKLGQISVDSTGIGSMEFPTDIIGDSLGELNVVAGIDENEIYGFVTAYGENNWGLPKHLISPDRPSRELWTPIAPLWMIITLIVMLVGVWGHYTYAVIQLILIKKSNKPVKKAEEETA
jgi:hypothetical protein